MLKFKFKRVGDLRILHIYKKNKAIGFVYEAYGKPTEIEINSGLSLSEIEEVSKVLESFKMSSLKR